MHDDPRYVNAGNKSFNEGFEAGVIAERHRIRDALFAFYAERERELPLYDDDGNKRGSTKVKERRRGRLETMLELLESVQPTGDSEEAS